MEMRKKGYEVHTYLAYQNLNKEVDFWAKKGQRNLFVQVTWLLGDPNENTTLFEREIGNLLAVKDQGEKILVSMDKELTIEGVRCMQPQEFILQL